MNESMFSKVYKYKSYIILFLINIIVSILYKKSMKFVVFLYEKL